MIITTATGQHDLTIDQEKGIITIDNTIVSINKVENDQVFIEDTAGRSSNIIEAKDIYRFFYGGTEPSPYLTGSLMATQLLHKQNERKMYSKLTDSEISLKSPLRCGHHLGNVQCWANTRSALIAPYQDIPGTFIMMPLCREHSLLRKREQKVREVKPSTQDGYIEYPIGQEG